jgi:glycosyltransferase involved in cell wall biosynthesis
MTHPDLSVVIPCFNEEQNLERGVLDEVRRTLERQPRPWEVLLVDDGSTDRSADLLRRFVRDRTGFHLLEVPHGGKPAAVWAGIRRARGEILLFTDMDQSTPLGEWEKLEPWYERGYDVVIGSRGIRREGFSATRRLSSRAFRFLRRLFVLRGISDTQCGFKSFRRRAALAVFPHLRFLRPGKPASGWKVTAFDVELLFLLARAGYAIREVEVDWRNRDESRTKHRGWTGPRYLRESIEMAEEVIHVRLKQMLGGYRDVKPGMPAAAETSGDTPRKPPGGG